MTFLVIGSNSFSGSNFVNYLLKKNFKTIGISRSKEPASEFLPYKKNNKIKNYKFYKLDINKNVNRIVKVINKYKPQIIVNFSALGMVAESWKAPLDWYETNFLSQVRFIEKIKKTKFIKKYINFTTPEVYGLMNNWTKENNIFQPSTPYALSRSSLDLHLLSYFKEFKFPVIFTRTANVYGPGQQLYRVVPKAIISCLKKKNFFLDGGGHSKRSFIHINDVSAALYKIAFKGAIGETYHISTNKMITVKKLVNIIFDLLKTKKNKIKISKDRIGKDQAYMLSSKKLRKTLKWSPKISLNEGIISTISWAKQHYPKFKRKSLNYKHKK
jgi:dTDP-glucose 4,6-dehydratase